MAITVRFFAGARAAAGTNEVRVPADTVAAALAAATQLAPDLERVLPVCSFLANGVAVHDQDLVLNDGDTLDVLPPFAGG